jgi:hypothetical protein
MGFSSPSTYNPKKYKHSASQSSLAAVFEAADTAKTKNSLKKQRNLVGSSNAYLLLPLMVSLDI